MTFSTSFLAQLILTCDSRWNEKRSRLHAGSSTIHYLFACRVEVEIAWPSTALPHGCYLQRPPSSISRSFFREAATYSVCSDRGVVPSSVVHFRLSAHPFHTHSTRRCHSAIYCTNTPTVPLLGKARRLLFC